MMFNERLIKHALAYEDLFRILRNENNKEGCRNVFCQMVEIVSQLSLKDQIDLLTLLYIGRFQDVDLELEPRLRFYEYRRSVETIVYGDTDGKYVITPADVPLEITASLAFGADTNFEGNSRLKRGIVLVQLPVTENRIVPYSYLETKLEKEEHRF